MLGPLCGFTYLKSMRLYFFQTYALIWLVFMAALSMMSILIAQMEWTRVLPNAALWGGLLAAAQTYREFKEKNLWPLYDNLQISKPVLLILTLVATLLSFIGLRFWLL